MPIPDFDADGFLPVGVYDCEWDELEHRFGQTENGASRAFLFAKLMEYRQELAATGLAMGLIVDGSFVTQTADPHDIDLVLILSKDHDFTVEIRPFEYNALSRRRVSKRFAFDLLVARDDSADLEEYIEFFQQVRGQTHRRKGILRVQP